MTGLAVTLAIAALVIISTVGVLWLIINAELRDDEYEEKHDE